MTSRLSTTARYSVRVAHYRAGEPLGPRPLTGYELVWLLDGAATWIVERPDGDGGTDRETIALRPGMLALAQDGTVDSYAWDPRGPSSHAYVHLDIAEPPSPAVRRAWPLVRPMTEPLAGLCAYLLELSAFDDEASRARSDELVALVVDLFLRGPFPANTATRIRSPHIRRLAEHVRRVWETDGWRIIPIGELAAAAQASPGHLARTFRQEFGTPPAQALELLRLGRAAIAVQRTDAPLRRIAVENGFSDAYHFTHRFTHVYGLPPGRFRRAADQSDPLAPVATRGLLPLWDAVRDGK